MASAFKWKLTDKPNNLFSYLTDENAGLPQINSGLTASAETVISQQVVTNFGNEQAYADQFEIMKGMIASNPATSGVTLLNYIYYYDMDENSCGLLNGGGGGTTSKGEKGDKGDPGERGPQGPQGIQGIQGRGISNITTTPLTGGTGNRVEVILTDGTTEHFDVMNGSVDYEYLQTLVESAVTVEVQNVSAYVKNSIVQYVSGELSSFTHIIQDASSITAEVVSRVSGLSMDMSKLQMTATAITATVVNLSGDVSTMTQSIQTASGIAWSAQRVANSANSQCADLKFSYSAITSQVERISSGMVTHSEITQLAERITLNVYNELNEKTGINIEDGTITLDAANTRITGGLNLYDDEGGITIFKNSIPVISINNKTLEGSNTSSFYRYCFGSFTSQQDINNVQIQTDDFRQSVLLYSPNRTYNINTMTLISSIEDVQMPSIDYVIASAYIKNSSDNSIIATLFTNKRIIGTIGSRMITLGESISFTPPSECYAYIYVDSHIYFRNSYKGEFRIQVTSYMSYAADKIVKIGNNGAMFVTGDDQHVILTDDRFELRNGTQAISLEKNDFAEHYYMFRTIGDSKADIGGVVPCRIWELGSGSSNMLQNDDVFVIATGTGNSTYYFYLPRPSSFEKGRKFYFKNLSNVSIEFTCNDLSTDYIIDANSKTPKNTHTIGASSIMWLCTGDYWVLFFCG